MDPTLKGRITNQLISDMPNFSNKLAKVAKYILDHPSEFGIHSIRETSARIKVSSNTLVRMANTLGFDTFDDLRAPFRDALLVSNVATADEEWLDRLSQKGELSKVQAEASAIAIGNVSKSLRDLEPEAVERVVKLLFNADKIFVVGVRASYSLAYYFHYVARMVLPKMSLIPRQMNPPIDDLANAGPDDILVAITCYPYSIDTIRTCDFAKKKGLKIVLISDSVVSAPELNPDEVLVASTVSSYHFVSYTGIVSILETLLSTLVTYGGAQAKSRIKGFEQLRDETDAYWQPKNKTNVLID